MKRIRHAFARPALEREAVAYEIAALLLAALTFHLSPNTAAFERFSRELGFTVTADLFAALCAMFIVFSVAVLFVADRKIQRRLYLIAPTPLLLYTVTYGIYLIMTGGGTGLTVVVYPLFWFAFRLISRGVFRDCAAPTMD
jgi:hypothetical protein